MPDESSRRYLLVAIDRATRWVFLHIYGDTRRQGVLFNAGRDRARSVAAVAVLDALNARFGRDTVHLGSAGLARRWAMLSENRTPRYTTSWTELPKVLAK